MFESALIRTAKRRGRWSILPISAVIHLIALAAVVSAQYWSVGPVAEPPYVIDSYIAVMLPPMPPGGGGGGTPPPPEPEAEAPEPEPQPQPEVVVPATVQPVAELVEREVPAPADVVTPVDLVDFDGDGGHRTGGQPATGGTGDGRGGPIGPGRGDGPVGPGDGRGPVGPGVTSAVPVRPGGAVSRPRATFDPKPQYTEMARRARVQGTVILDVIIDAQGRVKDVAVLKTLPMGLDASAAETVRRWRFEPATLNGRPVDCIMTLTVHFEVQ